MSVHTMNAMRNFEENLVLFANAQTHPEKYNLYAGLRNLAEALENIENELNRVRQQLQQLT